jgi:ferredoxin
MAQRPYRVRLTSADGGTIECRCPPDSTIAQALERSGIAVRLACRGGGCGACVAWLLAGSYRYLQPASAAKLASFAALDGHPPLFLCRAAPTADLMLHLPGGWIRRPAAPLSRLLPAAIPQDTR